jgi:CheY-like chemotaxis protein
MPLQRFGNPRNLSESSETVSEMSGFNHRILVVDDDAAIRESGKAVLATKGYEIITAVDGFDGLVQLRRSLPDLIISDLSMPNMSGFEFLSVVRKRFPQIPVIAISGAYNGGLGGVIADAFFFKGQYRPEDLFDKIRDLIEVGPVRAYVPRPDRAPIWVPVNETGYFVVTCLNCMRSSSISAEDSATELRELACPFCDTTIRILSNKQVLKKAAGTKKTA